MKLSYSSSMNDRGYINDFLGGVDPTGTRTFQYGMEDARQHGQSSGLRRAIGTAGGVVGGAAVIPAAVGGTIGGVKGFLMGRGGVRGRLVSAGKGFLSGAKKPYTQLYQGVKANSALAAQQAGRKLTPGQANSLQRFAKTQLPDSVTKGVGLRPKMVQRGISRMSPQQVAGVRRELGGEIGAGAAALGLSGAISGVSAHTQYGKGARTGTELRKADVPMQKTSMYYAHGFRDTLALFNI